MAIKSLFLCFLTLNLNAGDYRYEWADIGHFGLVDILPIAKARGFTLIFGK